LFGILNNLPYISKHPLAKVLLLPKELLFFGECGEYELLFTVKSENINNFLKESSELDVKFYKLGVITSGEKVLKTAEKKINLSNIHINARNFEKIEIYLKELIRIIEQ